MQKKKLEWKSATLSVWRIVAVYGICGVGWIVFSDRILNGLDMRQIQYEQTIKGCLFVLVTAGLLFSLLRKFVRQVEAANEKASESEESYKRAEDMIEFLANHDYLTNLPNLRVFYQETEQLIQHRTPFILSVIRIENFKALRAAFGRTTGNRIIQMAADRLTQCLGPDCTLTRVNDDTFKLLVPNPEHTDCTPMFRRMAQRFEQPFIDAEDEIIVSLEIGVSSYPQDGEDAEGLIRVAYYALSMAQPEKMSYMVGEQQRRDYKRRLVIEMDFPSALQRNQLSLVFQPKVSLATKQVVSAEALLRWNHPVLGPIGPSEFIPIAEEMGTILSIGNWVLQEACRQIDQLRRASGKKLSVAVNISARQFLQRNFVELVHQAVIEVGIEPSQLMLEITESIAMNVDASLPVLQELKKLGVRISMDDFGTGYCSISYLKHLPLDELKIDRSFVTDIDVEDADRHLVETITAMAHRMNIQVVAEGVEDEEQLRRIAELRCDLIQGYYFSPPLPIDGLLAYVNK